MLAELRDVEPEKKCDGGTIMEQIRSCSNFASSEKNFLMIPPRLMVSVRSTGGAVSDQSWSDGAAGVASDRAVRPTQVTSRLTWISSLKIFLLSGKLISSFISRVGDCGGFLANNLQCFFCSYSVIIVKY